jgi:RNA polymerase sigma-70 factor, ECF subfamily
LVPSDAVLARDAALMRRVAAGDEAALRALAQLHGGRVVRLAQRLLGSAAEADEVAQETLLRLWRRAGDWDSARGTLPTWLGTIAWRLCADRLRAPGRHTTLELDAAAGLASAAPDAEAMLARRQLLTRVQTVLDGLPARQRAAFLLFYVEEASGQEAAGILGLRIRAFWSLLNRARLAVEREIGADMARER